MKKLFNSIIILILEFFFHKELLKLRENTRNNAILPFHKLLRKQFDANQTIIAALKDAIQQETQKTIEIKKENEKLIKKCEEWREGWYQAREISGKSYWLGWVEGAKFTNNFGDKK